MQVVLIWVIALFLLVMVAKSSSTRVRLVLISFKKAGSGFMMGPGLLAMLWPECWYFVLYLIPIFVIIVLVDNLPRVSGRWGGVEI